MFDTILTSLGVTADRRFAYYIRGSRSVWFLAPTEHTKRNLLSIAQEEDWHQLLAQTAKGRRLLKNKTVRGKQVGTKEIYWDGLAGAMMESCRQAGRFDPNKVRGRGLWPRSDGTLVFNTGERLFLFDGAAFREVELPELAVTHGDPHRYVSGSPALAAPSNEEASADECRSVFNILDRFTWMNGPHEPKLIAGWIALATVLNLLPFRPHVAITAEKVSGKSHVLMVAKSSLGDAGYFEFEIRGSSEPGVRQTLGTDALPAICDEFETAELAAQAIIQLFRIASGSSSGAIVKGSADGIPVNYEIRTMALAGGVVFRPKETADQSRWVVVELRKESHEVEEQKSLTAQISGIDSRFGPRLQRRMINRQPQFKANGDKFKGVILKKGGDDREAHLYGCLYAAWWTVCHDEMVTSAEADDLLAWYKPQSDGNEDHAACLDRLLGYRLWNSFTVGEILREITRGKATKSEIDDLEAFGVRYDPGKEEVVIANRAEGIAQCFANSPWADGQHAVVFKRMGGHNGGNKTERFGTTPSKATWLPLDKVLPDVFSGSDEQL
jgi:putative DNA primase/helicase